MLICVPHCRLFMFFMHQLPVAPTKYTGHTRGFLKDADIAHVCTHRHTSSGDATYEFAYMFRIALDVSGDAATFTFPDMPGVVVFAATFVRESHGAVTPRVRHVQDRFQG